LRLADDRNFLYLFLKIMATKAFILILSSLIVALSTDSDATLNRLREASLSPFARCNPFNAQAKGITSCDDFFMSSFLNFGACDLNLGWHDICDGSLPSGKNSLREICPHECSWKVSDPELEDDDALAVQLFIDLLDHGAKTLVAPTCNEGFSDVTNGKAQWLSCGRHCPGGMYWTDDLCQCACEAIPEGYQAYLEYGSAQGNLIDQFEDLTAEECADLCNGQETLCAGFTIFEDGRCELKAAITLTQRIRTRNRSTYVKIVPGTLEDGSNSGNVLESLAELPPDGIRAFTEGLDKDHLLETALEMVSVPNVDASAGEDESVASEISVSSEDSMTIVSLNAEGTLGRRQLRNSWHVDSFGWTNENTHRCSYENEWCECTGNVVYTRKCTGWGVCNQANWNTVMSLNWGARHRADVVDGIQCSNGAFGGDPWTGKDKQCFCHPHPQTPECPSGYIAIPRNLDGMGKEVAPANEWRTIEQCASFCNSRLGCTSFEFGAPGRDHAGDCVTYTAGEANFRDNEDRLEWWAHWRSCVKVPTYHQIAWHSAGLQSDCTQITSRTVSSVDDCKELCNFYGECNLFQFCPHALCWITNKCYVKRCDNVWDQRLVFYPYFGMDIYVKA